jgi:hypothetical protein
LGIQTAECPIGKNHNPCGTGVFGFCKVAIGGLIATLQNFRYLLSFIKKKTLTMRRQLLYYISNQIYDVKNIP